MLRKPGLLLLVAGLAFGLLALPQAARADGYCTCVATSTAATKVLAAHDQGQKGRQQLCLQNVSVTAADYVACNIGNTTTVTIATGIILPAQSSTSAVVVPPYCFPPVQFGARTQPLVPDGQVNCIAAAGTPTVCACDQ
jgi:hypothetical protein